MVDLAVQAFSTNNFDLAAEIYERSIKEHGPTSNLCLGLADSYARAGQFTKAFRSYSNAFRLGSVSPVSLKHLVTALVETVSQDTSPNQAMLKNAIFDCLLCKNLLNDPVTIPCGHTFCRTCLQKEKGKVCKNCGTVNHHLNVSKIQTNVLLTQTIEKWFPEQCQASRLKRRANDAFQVFNLEDAIRLYTEAIQHAPSDHLLWSNRSHALAKLDRFNEALEDACKVIELRPDWPKGYFRKGIALYGLNKYEETVVAMLQCLALDTSVSPAKDYLSKALHQILSCLPPGDPKSVARQQELNPSMLENLIRANFNSSVLLPQVSFNSIRELQDIVKETVATASNFMSQGYPTTEPKFKDIDEKSGALPENMQIESNIRCRSAPSSRTSSPLPRIERCESSAELPSTSAQMDHSQSSESSAKTEGRAAEAESNTRLNLPTADPDVLNREDFECSLCYRMLYLPVTTPCGHTYCRSCLDRSLDHRSECPLCKSSLSEYLAERRQAVTGAIESILLGYFSNNYEQRKCQYEEEIAELASMGLDTQHEIPVFVCTMAYPNIGCPLHIFEPRYRLMIRQCMESGRRQFGMCIDTQDGTEFSEYGCMLEIREVQFFPDGRSLVDTVGGKRFKVLSRGHRDGYNTAKVEFLSDRPVEVAELASLRARSNSLYTVCRRWFDSLPIEQQHKMRHHLGDFPEREGEQDEFGPNGPDWHWYMIAILPLDPRIQLLMLGTISYKKRLDGLQRVLSYIQQGRR